jgi:hypothetical protein
LSLTTFRGAAVCVWAEERLLDLGEFVCGYGVAATGVARRPRLTQVIGWGRVASGRCMRTTAWEDRAAIRGVRVAVDTALRRAERVDQAGVQRTTTVGGCVITGAAKGRCGGNWMNPDPTMFGFCEAQAPVSAEMAFAVVKQDAARGAEEVEEWD